MLLGDEVRSALMRAAAAHRSEAGVRLVADTRGRRARAVAEQVVEALAPYYRNAKLLQRLTAALTERGESALLERLNAPAR